MKLRFSAGPVRGRGRTMRSGALPPAPPPPPPPLGYNMPTADQLLPYQTTVTGGFTAYKNVPWGPCFGVEAWAEPTLGGATVQPVMHIYMPSVAAPPGGYPVAARTHANGGTLDIPEGSGNVWNEFVLPNLALGHVVMTFAFRHPVPNVALGAPHNDIGYCLQFARSLHSALSLDRNNFNGLGQSRGTLGAWQSCAPELADAGSPNYAKRQSSVYQRFWGIGLQPTLRNAEYINKLVDAGDRAAMLAAPAYADNPAWGSIIALIEAGATPPHMCVVHETAYVNALPNYAVSTRSRAALEADDAVRLHNPDGGKWLREVMISAGHGKKIAICDSLTGAASMQDCAAWFKLLADNPGMSAAEARNLVMIRRLGGSAHYLPEAGSGAYVSTSDPTPVTTLGAAIGAIIDGSYGYANRVATTPLGASMVQTTTGLRTKLASLNGGTRRGFEMDAVDDEFRVLLANTTVDAYTYTTTGVVRGVSARTSARFTLTTPLVSGRTLALVAAVPNTTFSTSDIAFLGQWGREIAGV